MICFRIRYFPGENPHQDVEREYDAAIHEVKVLQSGVLKVVIPDHAEVPMLGSKGEDIAKTPAKLIAVFSGDYFLEVS